VTGGTSDVFSGSGGSDYLSGGGADYLAGGSGAAPSIAGGGLASTVMNPGSGIATYGDYLAGMNDLATQSAQNLAASTGISEGAASTS
jgi:hypothetical protein